MPLFNLCGGGRSGLEGGIEVIRTAFRFVLAFLELSFSLFMGASFLACGAMLYIAALRIALWAAPLVRRYVRLRTRIDRFFGRC